MKKYCVKQCYNYIFSGVLLALLLSASTYAQQLTDTTLYPPGSFKMISALNYKDVDIRDVFRSIAAQNQVNIDIEPQVNNRISVTLYNVRVIDAVRIIAESNNLDFNYDRQLFHVRTKKPKELPPSPAPEEPEAEVSYKKGKLTFQANNVEISRVIEKLRVATSKNFILSAGTSGRITGSLKNISFETGLRNIMQSNGFYITVKDSIYYINRSAYFSSIEKSNNEGRQSGYWVSAKNGRVTIDVVQASLDKIITDLANQLGLQILKLTVPNANVTLRLNEVPVEKAFNYLFTGTEFTFRKDNGIYIIGGKATRTLDNTKLVKLKYLRADKTKEKIPPAIIQNATINVSTEHNAIVVSGPNESVGTIENYLEAIDKPVAQVIIEALVVDYNMDKALQFGINAGHDSAGAHRKDRFIPGIDVTESGAKINDLLKSIGSFNLFGKDINVAKLGKLSSNFYVNIKALETYGVANIRSKPILSALNGYTASLKIGTVQNYVFNEIMPITSQVNSTYIERERIEKIEANISFEITPWVGPNQELTLEIKPNFETPVGEFNPDKRMIPAINTRSFQSTVRLRDGETIILGGLIQESENNTEDKLPILGDIPFLGKIFTNVNKKKIKGELVIYLTPKIIYGDEFGSGLDYVN